MSSFARKLQNRRWTGIGAVLVGITEAVGLVTTIAEKTEWYVPLAAFVVFVVLVILHVLSLHNEIEDKEAQLANRKRRRWIRKQLDQYSQEYKAILDTGNIDATYDLDARLKTFCQTNDELCGFWSVVSSGANLPQKNVPEWITTPNQKRVWFKCQTRRFHLTNMIVDFKD